MRRQVETIELTCYDLPSLLSVRDVHSLDQSPTIELGAVAEEVRQGVRLRPRQGGNSFHCTLHSASHYCYTVHRTAH